MDLSGLVMDDRDTTFLAVGTAFGSLQTPILKRVLNESPAKCSRILGSTTGMTALVTGVSFIAIGAAGRIGKIGLNKDVSSFVLGYGISCIISIMINYISAMALSDECRSGS
jgi:hypothetical protein